MKLGGYGDAQLVEQRLDLATDLGRLSHSGLGALVLHNLNGLELGGDVTPRVTGADLGDTFQQQRQHAQKDMSADATVSPVIDRTHAQAGLHRAPTLLDAKQLLVAERQIFGRQSIVVAGNYPLAVVMSGLLDLLSI